jgi:hypothetical protein
VYLAYARRFTTRVIKAAAKSGVSRFKIGTATKPEMIASTPIDLVTVEPPNAGYGRRFPEPPDEANSQALCGRA